MPFLLGVVHYLLCTLLTLITMGSTKSVRMIIMIDHLFTLQNEMVLDVKLMRMYTAIPDEIRTPCDVINPLCKKIMVMYKIVNACTGCLRKK